MRDARVLFVRPICDLKYESKLLINRAIVPLKQLTKEGYVMTFAKLLDTEPTKFIQNEAIKYLFMTCETQNLMQGTNQGQIIILDAAGAKFGHVARMSNPIILKKLLFYIQEAAPVRLKAIHVLNSMSIVDTIFNMIKPLMKPELINIVSSQLINYFIFILFLFNKLLIVTNDLRKEHADISLLCQF